MMSFEFEKWMYMGLLMKVSGWSYRGYSKIQSFVQHHHLEQPDKKKY